MSLHLTESSNPSFVTKEEFADSVDKMYTVFDNLLNRIQALEAKAEKEEAEPLLKVGDVVEITQDVPSGFRETARKGQKFEVLAVENITSEVVVYGEVSSITAGGYFYKRIITLSQDKVKKVEEPCPNPSLHEYENVGAHPLVEESLKALSALHNATLALIPDARLLGQEGEWRKKVDMVGDMIKQLKKALSNS